MIQGDGVLVIVDIHALFLILTMCHNEIDICAGISTSHYNTHFSNHTVQNIVADFEDDKFRRSYNTEELKAELMADAARVSTVINIDGFTRGTGTASCGPDVLPQFVVDGRKELEFSFYMMPLK